MLKKKNIKYINNNKGCFDIEREHTVQRSVNSNITGTWMWLYIKSQSFTPPRLLNLKRKIIYKNVKIFIFLLQIIIC